MFTHIIDEIIKRSEIRAMDITQEEKDALIDASHHEYQNKKILRQAENDADVRAMVAAFAAPKKSYADFERDLLENFRKEHPHSSAPRRHVIETLYDNYLNA